MVKRRAEVELDRTANDSTETSNCNDRRVYVSRIPLAYDEAALIGLFEKKFKCGVAGAEIKRAEDDVSRGFGFITFTDPADKARAIAKGSIHKDQRNIKIMELIDESLLVGRGRDVGICHNWSQFKCVKGGDCRFLHEGPGACTDVRPPGEGLSRKRCMSFKIRGKCSNPTCQFLHDVRKSEGSDLGAKADRPKVCFNFKSKGKCRKGDKCQFEHVVN